MRIVHVIKKRDPSCLASGIWTFVEKMHELLCERGIDSVIVSSKYDLIKAISEKTDIVHIHGIWHYFYHQALLLAKKNNIKVVFSTHGMTSPWAIKNNWWKKLPVWRFYQGKDLLSADAIHSMSSLEESWNRRLLPAAKTFLTVPLGTDEQKLDQEKHDSDTILFVGRICKVKSLDTFMRAIHLHRKHRPSSNFHFRIIGPDERNYLETIIRLSARLNLNGVVDICGYMDKVQLSGEYENALALVLPSKSENFGAVVVEALSHGAVVVATKNTPWEILQMRNCGWHVEGDEVSLAEALDSIYDAKKSGAIGDMQTNAVNLVDEFFRWPEIVRSMCKKYLQIAEMEA